MGGDSIGAMPATTFNIVLLPPQLLTSCRQRALLTGRPPQMGLPSATRSAQPSLHRPLPEQLVTMGGALAGHVSTQAPAVHFSG